mgnify:CR=1 FL=1
MTNADAIVAFADMLKRGEHIEAAERFNATGLVSIEAMEGPMARVEGRDAVKALIEDNPELRDEAGLYTMREGMIVEEQFFY